MIPVFPVLTVSLLSPCAPRGSVGSIRIQRVFRASVTPRFYPELATCFSKRSESSCSRDKGCSEQLK